MRSFGTRVLDLYICVLARCRFCYTREPSCGLRSRRQLIPVFNDIPGDPRNDSRCVIRADPYDSDPYGRLAPSGMRSRSVVEWRRVLDVGGDVAGLGGGSRRVFLHIVSMSRAVRRRLLVRPCIAEPMTVTILPRLVNETCQGGSSQSQRKAWSRFSSKACRSLAGAA